MSHFNLEKGIAIANAAIAEDVNKNDEAAIKHYDECIGYLLFAEEFELKKKCDQIQKMVKKYQSRSGQLKMNLVYRSEHQNYESVYIFEEVNPAENVQQVEVVNPAENVQQVEVVNPAENVQQVEEVNPAGNVQQVDEVNPVENVQQVEEVNPAGNLQQVEEVNPVD